MPDENKGIYTHLINKVKKDKAKEGLRPKTNHFKKNLEDRDRQIASGSVSKTMTTKVAQTKTASAEMTTLHPYLASLTSKQHENNEVRDLRLSQRLDDKVSTAEKNAKGFKPICWPSAPIFISGGPIRTLLHILLKNINNHSLEMPLFAMNIDLIRFLLFNEQSDTIQKIIKKDLGDFSQPMNDFLKFSNKDKSEKINLRRDTKDSINDLSNMLMR
jgi:hypothetical protein